MLKLIVAVACGVMLAGTVSASGDQQGPGSAPTSEASERTRLGLPGNLSASSNRDVLWSHLLDVSTKAADLREELASARAELSVVQRELGTLQQFILDHEEFGQDYKEYENIRAIAERETRKRAANERKNRLDSERAARREASEQQKALAEAKKLEAMKREHYARAGFSDIGLDVYLGRSAYFYAPRDTTQAPIAYQPGGGGTRSIANTEIDYSEMTISGSILNASGSIRNIGVAVTFFDEQGNQVGAEIIQIEHARPNVPYPFTSQLQMALNRPFTSSSSYVLYTDAEP